MQEKKILRNAEIIDLALFFPEQKILAIADLHLGFEETLNREGVMIPRFNFRETKKRLESILEKTGKLEKVAILGDLKHEFGLISEQEWNEVLDLLSFIEPFAKEIVLLKGNHDRILGPLAKWKNLKVLDSFFLEKEKVLFLHGDVLPKESEFKKAKVLVTGHEHPAVVLREGVKREKFKCFLKGKFRGKILVVLPSFNLVFEGTNVLKERLLSPFLKQDLSEFEVWVAGDKTYYFGELGQLAE